MHKSSVAPDIAIGLCLWSDLEGPFFYQQYNLHDVQNSKLIGHCVTTPLSVASSELAAIVADVIDPVTPSYSRFSCLLCIICVDYDCEFLWVIYCLQQYTG